MTVPAQETQAQAPAAQPNDKEINFQKQRQMYERQLEQERQARIQAEQERDAERARMAQKPVSDDDDDSEPYVDKKRLNKRLESFEEKIEKKIDQKAEQKAAAMLDAERRSQFLRSNPDFEQIMQSEDLLQKFADTHKELAEDILKLPPSFERQKLVYNNIKALGINKPAQAQPSIQEKIDANRKSPYYQPSGVGAAPYAAAGDFSPGGQKNAYAKMQELKNRLRI